MSSARIPSIADTRRPSRIAVSLWVLIAPIALALVATNASAACNQFQPPPELYVGNMASDSACTQNTIQAAIDAATCIYGTNIYITHEQTYSAQHLNIGDKNITLIGRVNGDVCGPAPPPICNPTCPTPTSPRASISGHSGDAILTITGNSNVTVRYLDLNNGTQWAGIGGGGIAFQGNGSLTIDTSWVRANHASFGGGIYFNGTGSTASNLNLLAYTQILANLSDNSGGGILINGKSVLNALQPGIQINGNQAPNGHGGGVEVIGPATANLGSPDSATGISLVASNSAMYGGGVSVDASDDGSARLFLFTTDPSKPVGIRNNTASHTGGGIYLKPNAPIWAATLNAWDFRIESNAAPEGAAIYADVDSFIPDPYGGSVFLGNTTSIGGGFPTALGAVPCTNSSLCNTINGNQTTNPSQGSIILVQDNGYLVANRFSMRGNHADHAIRVVGDDVIVQLFNGLLAENTVQHELIYESGNDVPTVINSCTFANDAIGAARVIHTESDLTLTDSIITEPGTLTLDYSGNPANLAVNYVLSNDISTLPDNGTGVIPGTPAFVDLAGGDYHLKATSLGIDFAPTSGATGVNNSSDLDNNPRNYDLPAAGNVFGTQDLGAYERQNLFRECGTVDSIFCDGFDHP